MFVRKKRNKSGTVSVQVIDKSNGYHVVKTIGAACDPVEVNRLAELGKAFIIRQSNQYSLFSRDEHDNAVVLDFVRSLNNSSIHTIGPELIFGRLFDEIGFGVIPEQLFRDIVVARLVYPSSKLKTVDYLCRYRGKMISSESIYRFLDRLNDKHHKSAQQIAYQHSHKILKRINVVFYDMTSLYFEAEDEDDLRKIGFSKDGKFQNPQIMLGLLVGENGYPIGYDIFEGNTFEGKTLLWHVEKAFRISKTDLRIRPMYHRRRKRIEAHVLVAFVAYTIYKKLERRGCEAGIAMSPKRAAELTQTMYEISFRLPNDPEQQQIMLQMDADQQQLYDLIC